MLDRPETEWPDLAVFLGDQIYADDSSPKARERIAEASQGPGSRSRDRPSARAGRRLRGVHLAVPRVMVAGDRALVLLRRADVMIFDDHEMIDDWNISDAWVRGIRQKDVVGGPRHRRADDVLDLPAPRQPQSRRYQSRGPARRSWVRSPTARSGCGSGRWAPRSSRRRPGNYRFSFVRDIGRVRLVMIDSRNAPGARTGQPADGRRRRMGLGRRGVQRRRRPPPDRLRRCRCSSPAACTTCRSGAKRSVTAHGARLGPQVRRMAAGEGRHGGLVGVQQVVRRPSCNCCAISALGSRDGRSGNDLGAVGRHPLFVCGRDSLPAISTTSASRVHQLVSSPIRNALRPTREHRDAHRQRRGSQRSSAAACVALLVGRRSAVSWGIDLGPVFDNSLGQIYFDRRTARLSILQVHPHDETVKPGFDTVIDFDLVAGSRQHHQTAVVRGPGGAGG